MFSKRRNPNGGTYSSASIATDSRYGAVISERILKQGGSAVDASIAALLCCGVAHPQSVSIASGGFMTVYDAETRECLVYDYRPCSPAAFKCDSFKPGDSKLKFRRGGYAVGVPGEIRGLRLAWQKHGRLPWSCLVQPSIDLARRGVQMSERGAGSLDGNPSEDHILKSDPGLRELLGDGKGGFKRWGDTIYNESYAKTLEIIRDNPEDLYTGRLAELYVEDVCERGGVITMEDMRDYTVRVTRGLRFELNGLKLCTTSAPGGGAILAHAINILKGYNISADDLKDENRMLTLFHRYIEAVKFAFSYRAYIGDLEANSPKLQFKIIKYLREAMSKVTADTHRRRIDDDRTHERDYYTDVMIDHIEFGTTHVSCIDEDGNAAAATESIDSLYGAGFRSTKTGIIFNNAMSDFFQIIDKDKRFQSPDISPNFPGPNKRPYSSMAPTIGVDAHGVVRLAIGASGGGQIVPALVWVLMLNQMCKVEIEKALRMPRLLPNLYVDRVYSELSCPVSEKVEKSMVQRGHPIVYHNRITVVQAVCRTDDNSLHAQADHRKKGATGGF